MSSSSRLEETSTQSTTEPYVEPTIAVVITCHNYGAFLDEAIQSVLAQSRPANRLIVVDDGSEDDTYEVCKRYLDQIDYLHQENMGVTFARNTGLRAAGTRFIVFLDADDRLHPEYLDRTLTAFLSSTDQVGFVYTQIQTFGREFTTSTYPKYNKRKLLKSNYVHASALFSTEVAGGNFYDSQFERGAEDWDAALTLVSAGYVGVLVDEPLLLCRRHLEGRSRSDRMSDPRTMHDIRLRIARKHRAMHNMFSYGIRILSSHCILMRALVASAIQPT